MIYFPGTINIVSTWLHCHIIYINNGFTSRFPAMHINLLCACWHSEAVKGSSSVSTRRLLISLCITSSLFLCPEPTDAPCSHYGVPAPPSPRWRPHPQGPHTLPYQGPRHLYPTYYRRRTLYYFFNLIVPCVLISSILQEENNTTSST
jgi:hypothetical protein